MVSGVSSRFVSASELEASRASSSSTAQEDYDPRSLFEKLQAQKEAKDAKYDEMYNLKNQFRGIDESESDFLAQVNREKAEEEKERKRREREEVELFRNARAGGKGEEEKEEDEELGMAGKGNGAGKEKAAISTGTGAAAAGGGGGKKKRKANSSLLGVVKKKPSTALDASKPASSTTPAKVSPSTAQPQAKAKSDTPADDDSSKT